MVKIDSLELENVKRVKAVSLRPSPDGLTVIGGRNGQGKTSVLDAIAWALGGNRYRPSSPKREGAATDPHLRIVLDNGIVVERKGKSGALRVTDPEGKKAGQQLLDGFLSQFALDLPRFMAMSEADKARALLDVIGVGDELQTLEQTEKSLYGQRTGIGQARDRKRGAAAEMPYYPEAPAEPVSAADLIREQQDILARNGENQRKRMEADRIDADLKKALDEKASIENEMERMKGRLKEASERCSMLAESRRVARMTADQLRDESTAEIEAALADIDATNQKVRTNAAKRAAEAEAEDLDAQYREMTERIDDVRRRKMALLDGADLPLPGLSVEDGRLTMDGMAWDCMSGSQQLRAAAAIARRMNPECGFVLVDKLEQMDVQTLAEFGEWAQEQGLQVIGTRVGGGDECSIVIEDGYGGRGIEHSPADVPATAFADAPALAPATADPVERVNPAPALSPFSLAVDDAGAGKWVM